jgi:hypothetical protein
MSFLSKLFQKWPPSLSKASSEPITSGDLITELADDSNLVDGKQTWELADEKKHDIEYMKRCCDAELETMKSAGLVAAPYYFERVAVLSRKAKNYRQEVHYCESYIHLVENYYARHGTKRMADVRRGPCFQAIIARLPKARALLAKSEQGNQQ